ncbi:hypothetical protein NMY22_g10253 [Coprinellus aureogranulatus]|nr:hypothetical protein NMY22_g10253 [Coprinellus aureogranulatus]
MKTPIPFLARAGLMILYSYTVLWAAGCQTRGSPLSDPGNLAFSAATVSLELASGKRGTTMSRVRTWGEGYNRRITSKTPLSTLALGCTIGKDVLPLFSHQLSGVLPATINDSRKPPKLAW